MPVFEKRMTKERPFQTYSVWEESEDIFAMKTQFIHMPKFKFEN